MKEEITEFHSKLTQDRSNNNSHHQDELDAIYIRTIKGFAADYDAYRKFMPGFLRSLEKNNPESMAYSVKNFVVLFDQLIQGASFRKFDYSVLDNGFGDDKVVKKMLSIVRESVKKDTSYRFSEQQYDLTGLSEIEKSQLVKIIIYELQDDAKKPFWDKKQIDTTMMQMMFLRCLLQSLDNIDLFYHMMGIFMDRLNTSEFYQAGRDLCEEIIAASHVDGVPELGYFNAFRFYSAGSVHAASIYANISLRIVLDKRGPYCEKYVKQMIQQGLKFFRNLKMLALSDRIYNNIPAALKYESQERRSLDHAHFTSLLARTPEFFPEKLLDYLHTNREDIFRVGISDALPWLSMLYNVRKIYKQKDAYHEGLDYYITIFEMIVPGENLQKHKVIIDGDSEDIIKLLKESLYKLDHTRHEEDFPYDNEYAIKVSSRLLDYSMSKKDASSFLLAMTLKSDYSILFRGKEGGELTPLITAEADGDSLVSIYEDLDGFMKALPARKDATTVIVGFSEGKLFEMDLFDDSCKFYELKGWNDSFSDLKAKDYFADFTFDDTVKHHGSVRTVLPEEFQAQEDQVKEDLQFAKLNIDQGSESICLVKDMKISNFPHNLFLDRDGSFVHQKMPVTNILSIEWFLKRGNAVKLPRNFTKSIWIPTESGDIELNYLFSNIEETLKDNLFEVDTKVKIAKPLSADINIVCSHGARNISETEVIFQNDTATYELGNIIGKGKILIFFVCYSGSMRTEFFRNNVASMIKSYIEMGYEAVIAPFWALEVTIPRYWLSEFLSSLENGSSLDHAVFNANRKVNDRYPVPAAWACLHLYGNPNLSIEQ